jgi:uncharacterized membrane protein YphA (DoxX/SURF4 family)
MNIALWIAQGLLTALYIVAGGMKVFTPEKMKAQMPEAQKHSTNFFRMIGTLELLGALGVILPMVTGILPWLTPLAAIALVVVQILAILTVHLPAKEYQALPFNLFLLALAVFVAIGRFSLFLH